MVASIALKRLSALSCFLLMSSPAIAAGELCARIDEFHTAAFDKTVEPEGRRWVEMHWRGHWGDFDKGFGLQCLHSKDRVSREFCQWLVHHTPREFSYGLPLSTMTCFGYRFPEENLLSNWRSDFDFLRHNRWLLLEVDFISFKKDDGAVRLSSFAKGKDKALIQMPPLSASAN